MSSSLERRLQFASQSQSQTASPPTMSQNLANAFRGCQIQSQSQRFPGFDLSQHLSCSQARPAAVQPTQPNCESTSQEFLRCDQATSTPATSVCMGMNCSCDVCSTPDFITPVDQQYGGPDEAHVQMRSPAQLSPTRAKRHRPNPGELPELPVKACVEPLPSSSMSCDLQMQIQGH